MTLPEMLQAFFPRAEVEEHLVTVLLTGHYGFHCSMHKYEPV